MFGGAMFDRSGKVLVLETRGSLGSTAAGKVEPTRPKGPGLFEIMVF